VSDFTDVLIDDSCAHEAAGHLARELTKVGGWWVIDLPEVPHSAATAHLVDAWPWPTWTVGGSVCLEFPAVHLLLDGHDLLGAYLYGLQPDLRVRIDVAQLFLGTNLDLAQRLGRPTLSLLRGDEPYKRRWRPEEMRNRRVLLAAKAGYPAAAYAATLRVRQRLTELAKSRVPALSGIRRRLRTCRPSST